MSATGVTYCRLPVETRTYSPRVPHADDVPLTVDLRDPAVAHTWVREAEAKRPGRSELRAAFAEALSAAHPPMRRVLELGAGPGLLAERILQSCTLDSYTLFDFSPPMLELARARVGAHPATEFVLGDFKQPDWVRAFAAPFDAVVAMQSVHEIRHKRHVPGMYRQVHDILRPGGLLLVCDHVPHDDSARMTALHSTVEEQHAALISAGFCDVTTRRWIHPLYLCGGHRAP